MSPIGSNSVASQAYSGIQSRVGGASGDAQQITRGIAQIAPQRQGAEFKLPQNATPKGEWVLSSNADPQSFDANSPRGTYLNMVV